MTTRGFGAAALLVGLSVSPLSAAEALAESKPVEALAESKPAPKTGRGDLAEGKPRFREDKSKAVEVIDSVDFVFVASDRPVLLRLHVRNGARPYSAAWDDYMQKLYAYLDKNGDGVLDKAEAERAPDIRFLQFQLQGSIGIPYRGSAGGMAQFDSNKDGKVSLAEFKEFYRRGGITPLQIFSNSNSTGTDTVTDTLYKRLDSNKDGKLSAEEMARAPALLQRLDLDENEMLTTSELTGGGDSGGYGIAPRAGSAGSNDALGFLEIKAGGERDVARQVLMHYDKDKNGRLSRAESGLDKKLFDILDANSDDQLDAEEFAGFFRREADLELIGRMGKLQEKEGLVIPLLREAGVPGLQIVRAEVFNPQKRDMPLAAKVRRSDPTALAFHLGDARIGLSVADQEFSSFPRRFFERQFQQADVGKKGVVDRKQAMTADFLGQIFDLVDRDGDGKLTAKELKVFLDVQTAGGACRIQLSINEEGRSLFDLLDEDGDGRLSIRELRTAWTRMKPLAKSDNGLARQDILRRLSVSVGPVQRGFRPVGVRGNGVRNTKNAPLWFQKMDRNQDGDVSPREFIGSDEDFRKLDADGDGLISGEEARQFDERVKKIKANAEMKKKS